MSNSVEYTKIDANSDTSTKTINYINENASDSDVALFVASLNSLSKDTLTAINRVEGESVPTVPASASISGGKATHVINLEDKNRIRLSGGHDAIDTIDNFGEGASVGSDRSKVNISNFAPKVSITGSRINDTITNSGDYVSIFGGTQAETGDDTIYNTGNSVLIRPQKGADFVVNHGDNVTVNLSEGTAAAIDTVVSYSRNITVIGADDNDVITYIDDTIPANNDNT